MNPSKVEENYTQTAPLGPSLNPPTVIPVVVPTTGSSATRLPAPWSTGLCDCFDDVGNCLVTCFCPCITFGRVAEIVDRGATPCGVSGALYAMICCLMGFHWVYSCFYRSKMRGLFFLEESPCHDCVLHFCCDSCALCQEYRELKNRGVDVEYGWKGNLGPQSATIPPAIEGDMAR